MKIGVDLGGSHIGIGVIEKDGKVLEKREKRIKSIDRKSARRVVEEYIIENTKELMGNYKVTGMGIAIPGTVNKDTVLRASNLGLENYKIVEELQGKIDLKINLKNDAKAAAIAEKEYGSLKNYKNSLFFTLGTGVGFAVIKDNKLLEPEEFPGFELGHTIIKKGGIECNCGKKGCLEKYASMKAFKDNLREKLGLDENTSGKELLEIIRETKKGDKNFEKIEKVINEFVENVAIGLSNAINIFEPEAISIGGSFVYFEDVLLNRIKEELLSKNYLFNKRKDIIIKTAILGNDAGMIGAVL